MKFTKTQIKAMNQLRMSRVIYRNMWKTDRVLGYTTKGHRYYEINIANDVGNDDFKSVVMLHELGHQIYGHFDDVDLKKEMKDIKEMFNTSNVPYKMIRKYGGPHSFINIAMDLYINSTFLTPNNCSTLTNAGFQICTLKSFGFEYQNDFRDYYQLMIDKLKSAKEEEESNKNNDSSMNEGSEQGFGDSDNDNYDNDSKEDNSEHNDPFKDIKDAADNLMKDFIDTVSALNDDIDEEIQDEIYNENYISGIINASKDNKVEESNIDKYMESHNIIGDKDTYKGTYDGEVRDRAIVECDKDENISKFLSSIVNFGMEYKIDSMRRYNIGSRKNTSGVLYSSFRRKNSMTKQKLGILIDCSGSMDSSSLIKAIKSLRDKVSNLNPESVVVAWDYECQGQWNIGDIPNTMPEGSYTDIAKGVEYLNSLNCTDIVIYSDMATEYPTFIKALENFKGNVYSIIVGVLPYKLMKRDTLGNKAISKMNRYIVVKGEYDCD